MSIHIYRIPTSKKIGKSDPKQIPPKVVDLIIYYYHTRLRTVLDCFLEDAAVRSNVNAQDLDLAVVGYHVVNVLFKNKNKTIKIRKINKKCKLYFKKATQIKYSCR